MNSTEIILLIILSLPFTFTVYAIIDVCKSEFISRDNKRLWMLILFFAPVVSTLIYMWFGDRYKANYRNRGMAQRPKGGLIANSVTSLECHA